MFERGRRDARILGELAAELQQCKTQRARQLAERVSAANAELGGASEVREGPAVAYASPPPPTEERRRAAPRAVERVDGGEPPSCPSCQSPMVVRSSSRGRFWGCPGFPECRGTRDLERPETRDAPESDPRSTSDPSLLPVAWGEAVPREGHVAEYVSVGALPGVLRESLEVDGGLSRTLSQCFVLSRRGRPREGGDHARLTSGLLIKAIQRGLAPPPTLGIEQCALRVHGFVDQVTDLAQEEAEVGWEARRGSNLRVGARELVDGLSGRAEFRLDHAFDHDPTVAPTLLGSPCEASFLTRWVPEHLGPPAGHWFTPQASLDVLLEGAGAPAEGARRIDFLFHHPGGPPLAIEIDGPEHDAAVDSDRDEALRGVGIEVLRVPNAEVDTGAGPVLDRVRARCAEALESLPLPSDGERRVTRFVEDCVSATRVQFVVARALAFGWLTPGADWRIELSGVGEVAVAGVLDLLALLQGLDVLYDGLSTPRSCTVIADGHAREWALDDAGTWRERLATDAGGEVLRISVEREASPFQEVETARAADFVLRPAFLPVRFASEHSFELGRRQVAAPSYEEARPALSVFLQHVFRKAELRPMQGEAIFNALRQVDSVVLLPTGAGKSLIYQLAGLLMPGVTLVVDPLISLIEDQVEGLGRYGVDRAAPIASNLASPEERPQLLLRMERGEYQFVLHSPERLQSPQFRGALRALVQGSLVNLAVIDEAHCVSEWGHDFRPAYLHLASNLRSFGADREGRPPPILALTGTASRAVLHDVLTELDIDRDRSDALIRPDSFDRSELSFEILRTTPSEDPEAVLRGALHTLPRRFGLPHAEFYRPCGRATASGIVFVPTVGARTYGILDAARAVREATGADVTYYSGKAPRGHERTRWNAQKRRNAKEFKGNRVPVLVATKAFGMGIDKPNIRYTLHFGLPSSLESLYQEAGRAGRDRRPARCGVVFSELDPARSDDLLDPSLPIETLRERFDAAAGNRRTGDDVTRALRFHLDTFSGKDQEVSDVARVLEEIGDISCRQPVELPFWDDDENKGQEKAIYRLLKLGVLRDYEVEFGARKFVVDVDAFDLDSCKRHLLEYVQATQPAKARVLARTLDEIEAGGDEALAVELARILIGFTYDVIERSRRRMIQEAVLLARRARDDGEIRTRLLDYLQEGIGAERFELLLRSDRIDLGDWWAIVEKIRSPMDAGEVRGLCVRALESYPDHPGLLMTRSIAEVACSDHDDAVCAQGLTAALSKGLLDYEIPQAALEEVRDAMIDRAFTSLRDLGPPLALTLFDLARTAPTARPIALDRLNRLRELDDDRVRAVRSAAGLVELLDRVDGVVALTLERMESAGVRRQLDGERS